MKKNQQTEINQEQKSLKILIANGVNLDLLGRRNHFHYGHFTLEDLESQTIKWCREFLLPQKVTITPSFFQSNSESDFLSYISKDWDGIVLNAGAWTHTSLALADRLEALGTPFIEAHISNLSRRESYRKLSYLTPLSVGLVSGLGMRSYQTALFSLVQYLIDQE